VQNKALVYSSLGVKKLQYLPSHVTTRCTIKIQLQTTAIYATVVRVLVEVDFFCCPTDELTPTTHRHLQQQSHIPKQTLSKFVQIQVKRQMLRAPALMLRQVSQNELMLPRQVEPMRDTTEQ